MPVAIAAGPLGRDLARDRLAGGLCKAYPKKHLLQSGQDLSASMKHIVFFTAWSVLQFQYVPIVEVQGAKCVYISICLPTSPLSPFFTPRHHCRSDPTGVVCAPMWRPGHCRSARPENQGDQSREDPQKEKTDAGNGAAPPLLFNDRLLSTGFSWTSISLQTNHKIFLLWAGSGSVGDRCGSVAIRVARQVWALCEPPILGCYSTYVRDPCQHFEKVPQQCQVVKLTSNSCSFLPTILSEASPSIGPGQID